MNKCMWAAGSAAAILGMTFSMQVAAHDEPVIGVVGGAAGGALIGGPPGAVAGAVIGAVAGAAVAHESDHGHHHHRYVDTRVRYVQPARYVEAAPAPVYACEPHATYYRPTTVYRESYPKYTHAVAAKPKLRKVCRYERVRATTTAAAKARPVG